MCVALLLAVSTVSTPAAADDSSPWAQKPEYGPGHVSNSHPELDVVSVVADEIHRLGYSQGIAQITVDEDAKRVIVLWHGQAPGDVRAYTDASPNGVKVVHESGAKFSRKDVHRAVHAIQNSGLIDELTIVGLDPADDYSKIILKLQGHDKPSAVTMSDLEKLAGVPLEYSLGHKPAVLFGGAGNSDDGLAGVHSGAQTGADSVGPFAKAMRAV